MLWNALVERWIFFNKGEVLFFGSLTDAGEDSLLICDKGVL